MANSPVMGNIVERKFNEKYKFDSNRVSTVEHELGFPKVFKLDDNVLMKKVCYMLFYKACCFYYFQINYNFVCRILIASRVYFDNMFQR